MTSQVFNVLVNGYKELLEAESRGAALASVVARDPAATGEQKVAAEAIALALESINNDWKALASSYNVTL